MHASRRRRARRARAPPAHTAFAHADLADKALPGGPDTSAPFIRPGADAAVDFALVKVDADRVAWAHPRMLGHDGSGIANRTQLPVGTELSFYGHGLLPGETSLTRARATGSSSAPRRRSTAPTCRPSTDSGGPILETETGLAMGIISHYGFGSGTTDEGPLMTFVMAELRKAGFDVTLATV